MNRAIRRHRQQVAKARRIRILKTHGAWKVRESFVCGEPVDWTWTPRAWRSMNRLVMNEPGWWCHERMVVPARILTHHIEHLVERGADPDACRWPDFKKPHEYYW